MRIRDFFCTVFVLSVAALGLAQSSCSASNEQNDTCNISCPEGQAATCFNATGANAPMCYCGSSSKRARNQPLSIPLQFERMSQPSVHAASLSQRISHFESTQAIDVRDAVNAKLATLRDYHLRDECVTIPDPPKPHDCRDRPDGCGGSHNGGSHQNKQGDNYVIAEAITIPTTTCHQVMGKLAVQPSLVIVSGPTVTIQEPNWHSIPYDVFTLHLSYKNCTSLIQDTPASHSFTETSGQTITNTKSLVTGSSNQLNLHAGFHIGIVDFGASDTLTVSAQTTLSDSSTINQTEQRQQTIGLTVHAAPMTDTEGTHSIYQYYVPVTYSGLVQIDGSLSPNMENLTQLSQVLAEQSDRTFSFAGLITTTLVDVKNVATGQPLSAAACAGISGPILEIHSSRLSAATKP